MGKQRLDEPLNIRPLTNSPGYILRPLNSPLKGPKARLLRKVLSQFPNPPCHNLRNVRHLHIPINSVLPGMFHVYDSRLYSGMGGSDVQVVFGEYSPLLDL